MGGEFYMKRMKNRFMLVFLAGIVMMCFEKVNVRAEDCLDLNRKGSITITLTENAEFPKPMIDVECCMYHVANIEDENDNVSYVFTEKFKHCGISLTDLNAEGLSEHLAVYAEENKIDGICRKTNEEGKIEFPELKTGVYLIKQKNDVQQYEKFLPFLITVPMVNEEGNGWVYEINANPKTEKLPDSGEEGDTSIKVEKIWEDDGKGHKKVKVSLCGNGVVTDTVVLNESNKWKYEWNKLDKNTKWTVVEKEVPEGYTVSYQTSENKVIITNKNIPVVEDKKNKISVKKVWKGSGKHPDSVEMELWNGNQYCDLVKLNDKNNWTYSWTNLPESNSWKVVEKNIPDGYQVRYTVNQSEVLVTNSKLHSNRSSLIQTGQLNWPIPLLALAGIILIVVGWRMRKNYEK